MKRALTTIVWLDRSTVLRYLHFETQDSLNLLVAALSSFLGRYDHSRCNLRTLKAFRYSGICLGLIVYYQDDNHFNKLVLST
jgi:hypothetical protein